MHPRGDPACLPYGEGPRLMRRSLFICQIGGRLTALRYPEREIVAVHGLLGRGPDWLSARSGRGPAARSSPQG
jgi:hypothetical protein